MDYHTALDDFGDRAYCADFLELKWQS